MDELKDPATGVAFPAKQAFWKNGMLTCLGVGARIRKIGFISVKVYALSQYIDADAAAAAASKPGCEAAAHELLLRGGFVSVLQMHLVRDVTGQQFTDTFDEVMRPLMKGDEAVLDEFCSFFGAQKLQCGTVITFLRHPDGSVDICLRAPGDATPFAELQPGLTISCPRLGATLWGLFLGPDAPSPEARKAWLAAAARLGA